MSAAAPPLRPADVHLTQIMKSINNDRSKQILITAKREANQTLHARMRAENTIQPTAAIDHIFRTHANFLDIQSTASKITLRTELRAIQPDSRPAQRVKDEAQLAITESLEGQWRGYHGLLSGIRKDSEDFEERWKEGRDVVEKLWEVADGDWEVESRWRVVLIDTVFEKLVPGMEVGL